MQTSDVYQYTCFKSFLLGYAEYARANYRAWSYTKWAKRLGLKGTASLTLVLSGKRLPGPSITEKLIHYFKFEGRERRYFLDLIQMERLTKLDNTNIRMNTERARLEIERQIALAIRNQTISIDHSKLPEVFEFLQHMQSELKKRFETPTAGNMFLLSIELQPLMG